MRHDTHAPYAAGSRGGYAPYVLVRYATCDTHAPWWFSNVECSICAASKSCRLVALDEKLAFDLLVQIALE